MTSARSRDDFFSAPSWHRDDILLYNTFCNMHICTVLYKCSSVLSVFFVELTIRTAMKRFQGTTSEDFEISRPASHDFFVPLLAYSDRSSPE